MKKLILAMSLIASISSTATADIYQECEPVEGVAMSIIDARQSGVTMSKMMTSIGETDFLRAMIIAAYKEPLVSGPLRQRIVTEFGNKWYAECLRIPQGRTASQ